MIKKTLKITLKIIIPFIFILFFCVYFLLYSQTGTRWLIHYFSDSQSITIDKIEGTIAHQLKLKGVRFKTQQFQLHSQSIEYIIEDIQWFSKKVSIEKLELTNVKIIKNETLNHSKTHFEGLVLPIDFKIELLKINQLSVITATSNETFNQVHAKFWAQQQEINFSNFNLNHRNFKLKGQGQLQLTQLLPFKFEPQWSVFDDSNMVSGQGLIQGTIESVDSKQNVFIEQGFITGNLQINSLIDLKNEQVLIDTQIISGALQISVLEQQFKALKLQLNGTPESYKMTVQFEVEGSQKETLSIQLEAQGDFNSIHFESIYLNHKESMISLPTQLSWNDNLIINSELQFINFNPALFFPDWSGKLNGSADLKSEVDQNGQYTLVVKNAAIDGQLKQQNFNLNTQAVINKESIQFMPSQLQIGKNELKIFGQMNKQLIDLNLEANLLELSIFDHELRGQISSKFNITGELNNPIINGLTQARNIQYKNSQIKSMNIESKGHWNENLIVKAKAHHVNINNNPFDSINLEISGNQISHQISASLHEASVTSNLILNGSWEASKQIWEGQVSQSNFLLKQLNSQWKLIKPVQMSYQKALIIEPACWENKQTDGDFCLDLALNFIEKDYQVNLQLNKLEVDAFNPFLAKDLAIDGQLVGEAQLHLNQNLHINSNLELINGVLNFNHRSDKPYRTNITKAQLNAQHTQSVSNINAKFNLDDGSDLKIDLNLFNNIDHQLAIKGKVSGFFANTAYLASLTNEVEEIHGDFNIDGEISGLLSKPILQIKAQQAKGYLVLSQTKTKIENLKVQIDKQHNQPYSLDLRGSSGSGSVTILAELQILDDNHWQLLAKANGDSFEILKLPELELAISPEFEIKADSNGLIINGSFKIPSAQLNIEQYPENTINSSADVVIHQSQNEDQQNLDYPISFDLNAEIDHPINIKALGLSTDITGSIRVNNKVHSQLKGFGSLKLQDGQYTIYGQTLEVSKGELHFNGPLDNPIIDVTASRKSIDGKVVAGVKLGGNINQLQSILYSEPKLTDLEILSYIMTGKGLNQDSNFDSEQLVQAAIILGLQKSSPIFSEIQNKLGIDVLNIKEGSSAKDSLIEAGKNVNEKLYVGYNQGLFNRVGFWVLRYKINQALRLETTQGENQSVDLIYLRRKK